MAKKLGVAALAFLMLGPSLLLLAIGVLVNPAANAACTTTGGGVQVASVPESLTVTTKDGTTFTLNHQQLTHAATIITVGSTIDGVNRDGLQIAIMAALTESTLRMLANTSAYPDSAHYPHDGNGSDHDSLGLFQMRPAAGWGSVKDLMDPAYQVKAFFGGPTGPNYPSPRGLLDIRGWQTMDKGAAAQAVEVSAYPDRYQNFEPVARTILDTLTTPSRSGGGGAGARIPETSRIVFPLPASTWVMTSAFGPRIHPITGQRTHHSGTDYAVPDGTAIFAVADGVVARAQYTDSGGGSDRDRPHHRRASDLDRLPAHVAHRHPCGGRGPRERRTAHRGRRLLGYVHRPAPASGSPAHRRDLHRHRSVAGRARRRRARRRRRQGLSRWLRAGGLRRPYACRGTDHRSAGGWSMTPDHGWADHPRAWPRSWLKPGPRSPIPLGRAIRHGPAPSPSTRSAGHVT